ncbi:ABC transporter permease [Paenarthrobacter sp. DKR-5]|uniref:ABC transporter permease n=1 Tax=Paenarthrobacter sp. DKR-5 TaxID=2835535 RepID=UPI001BDDA2A2|nr:ABC transporter permease [Paenarthrobacter sp. DKR-5]MBT1002857.1 ABC transporter permease [Paenarthrobacter sp. DKR-5]
MSDSSGNILVQTAAWFTDPEHWSGSEGIPARLGEHLLYTGLTVLIAAAIAVPVGLYVGHTGRGRVLAVAVAGALRAIPTLGLLTLFVLLAGIGLMPPIWALVILTVPPLLAGTYSGIAAVDRNVVDAARSMGMNELQVLFKVEAPNALPVFFGGFRTAVLQVIATVTVVAFTNLGGFGRYLLDGLDLQDFPRMLGGAVLVAALALLMDGILAFIQKMLVSPGLRSGRRPADAAIVESGPLPAGAQGGTE